MSLKRDHLTLCVAIKRLPGEVLEAVLLGLESFTTGRALDEFARYRLAFRELGLSIGLKGITDLSTWVVSKPMLFGKNSLLAGRAADLAGYLPLTERIETFWLDDRNRAVAGWSEHQELNMVMLATGLAPDEFLTV